MPMHNTNTPELCHICTVRYGQRCSECAMVACAVCCPRIQCPAKGCGGVLSRFVTDADAKALTNKGTPHETLDADVADLRRRLDAIREGASILDPLHWPPPVLNEYGAAKEARGRNAFHETADDTTRHTAVYPCHPDEDPAPESDASAVALESNRAASGCHPLCQGSFQHHPKCEDVALPSCAGAAYVVGWNVGHAFNMETGCCLTCGLKAYMGTNERIDALERIVLRGLG